MSSISLKIDKLFGELSEDYKAILLENDFIYIFSKSIYFLKDGESICMLLTKEPICSSSKRSSNGRMCCC